MTENESLLRLVRNLFRKTQRLEAIIAQMATAQIVAGSNDAFDEAIRRIEACAAAHADHCPMSYSQRLDRPN